MVLWGKICLFINAPPSIERSNPVDTGVAYNSNCQHYYLFFNCRKIIHLTDVSQSINCYWIHYYYLLSVGHDGTTIWCSTSLIKGCRILSRLLLTPSYCCKDLMNRVRNFLQYKAAVDNRHFTNNFFFFFLIIQINVELSYLLTLVLHLVVLRDCPTWATSHPARVLKWTQVKYGQ